MSAEGGEEAAAAGGAGPGLCWVSLFSCLGLACSYVGSLYVWKSHLPRDHPAVIKRRFTSVLVVSTFSPLFIWVWKEVTGIKPDASLLTLMGFRLEGIVPATLLPLLLTVILFLGPLIQLSMDCPWDMVDGLRVALDPRFWVLCLTDMRWLRNQVIAPFTEELVFRACMVPMLVPCTGVGLAIVTCPLFFGVAHFHHVIEQLRFRQGSRASIFLSAGGLEAPNKTIPNRGQHFPKLNAGKRGLKPDHYEEDLCGGCFGLTAKPFEEKKCSSSPTPPSLEPTPLSSSSEQDTSLGRFSATPSATTSDSPRWAQPWNIRSVSWWSSFTCWAWFSSSSSSSL